MVIKEKNHRLPSEYYRGETTVAFTLCIKDRKEAFTHSEIIAIFTDHLREIIGNSGCIIPAYCFMPDHQHIIIAGMNANADTWKTLVRYKQKTGYWMSRHTPHTEWQKDFYDHVIKEKDDVARQVRYVLDNPVRKGLAASWRDYPFKGSLGCDLESILAGMH
jgi:putative transposase